MADSKISELTSSAAQATDLIPVARSGDNYAVTVDSVLDTKNTLLSASEWVRLPAVYKFYLDGVGDITIDTRTKEGTTSIAAIVYPVNGPEEYYEFFEGAYEIRVSFSGTATMEIV